MIQIKPEFQKAVVAFGGNGLCLDKRSQVELLELAIIAAGSNDPTLTRLFVSLPSLQELQLIKLRGIESIILKTDKDGKQSNKQERKSRRKGS